jgi:hypothetical protein
MDSETASSAYTRDQTGLTPDERIGALFQPDSLLSTHYFETLRRKTILEPEKRLMLAILEDAIHCFQDNLFTRNVRGKRLCEEAEEWIVEADGDRVFSFENICEALGLTLHMYVRVCCDGWRTNYQSTLRGPRHGVRRWLSKVIRETGERETTQSSVRTEQRRNCFTAKYLASSRSQITKDEKNFEI